MLRPTVTPSLTLYRTTGIDHKQREERILFVSVADADRCISIHTNTPQWGLNIPRVLSWAGWRSAQEALGNEDIFCCKSHRCKRILTCSLLMYSVAAELYCCSHINHIYSIWFCIWIHTNALQSSDNLFLVVDLYVGMCFPFQQVSL